MQNPANEVPQKQDPRDNVGAAGDSSLMTIEYLRARLHSERSVSKAARERADELAKRVEELEEQLEIVTLQRKRAEKATLDVLAVLENHGVSDLSEVVYSGSEEEAEGSLCESNNNKGKLGTEGGGEREEGESSGEPKQKGEDDDKEEISGSEHDSTRSIGRSLSWKSRKELQRSTEKKYTDSSIRRRTHFALTNSSPRQLRLGKSCRQIQRKEIRSVVEESRYESLNFGRKDSNVDDSSSYPTDSLDSGSEGFKGRSGNWNHRVFAEGQVSGTLESQGPEHEFDGEMERALKRQAQLIGRYEAQEKAQREWEENYRESNDSPLVSCEPENQSDITEERDDIRAASSSQPAAITACSNSDKRTEEAAACFSKQPTFIHFNSFKVIPPVDSESSVSPKPDERPKSRAPAPDFAFPVINDAETHHDSLENNTLYLRTETYSKMYASNDLHGQHASFSSMSASQTPDAAEAPQNRLDSYAIIPHEGPQRIEQVLDSLHNAKMLLRKEYNGLSLSEGGSRVGRAVEPSASAGRDVDILRMPVSAAALSKVPTDFESKPPGQARILVPVYYSQGPAPHYPYSNAPVSRGDLYLSNSLTARPSATANDHSYHNVAVASEHRALGRAPWLELHDPDIGRMPYPIYQDAVPHMPPDGTGSYHFSSRTGGLALPNGPLYHRDRAGRDMYRY